MNDWRTSFYLYSRGLIDSSLWPDDILSSSRAAIMRVLISRLRQYDWDHSFPNYEDFMRRELANEFARFRESVRRKHRRQTRRHRAPSDTDDMVIALSRMVPMRSREPYIGDLIADIKECRAVGWGEWRIRLMVIVPQTLHWIGPRIRNLGIFAWIASLAKRFVP